MAVRNHTTARRSFGREIRAAREALDMSRSTLAEVMVVSPGLVQAWESGRQHPKHEYIGKLISTLKISSDVLLSVLEELMDGETSPEWTDRWLAIEKHAKMLLSYEHSVIPGLLQIEAYAQTVLQQGQPLADVTDKMQSRLGRQEILRGEDAPTCVFIMNEHVLRNQVGSVTTMRDQMSALVGASNLPNLIIQIIPDDRGYHPGQTGAFMLARFEGNEFAYQDGTWRGQVMEDIADTAAFSRIWMNLHAIALDKRTSLELIERVARDLWSE